MIAGSNLLVRKRGIIIAADVSSLEALGDLVEISIQVPEVAAIKVGFTLALRFGLPRVTATIKSLSSLPIIYDHQKAGTDIPQMGKPFAQCCRDSGIAGVIIFPLSGPRTLESFVSASLAAELTPIVGLVMTHEAYLRSEGGFIADESPDAICRIAKETGVRHFVLPGTKTSVVTRFAEGPLSDIRPTNILMPGIGAQGGSISDAFASAGGHNPYAIIGSAIYKAAHPLETLKGFAAEVREPSNESE